MKKLTDVPKPSVEENIHTNNSNGVPDLGVTRRTFVKGASVLTGAVLTGLPAVGSSDTPHTSTPVKQLALKISINGEEKSLMIDPRMSLLDLLREQLQFTGTKKGCDHGQCGACTVLSNGRRINSCLALAIVHDGDEITTIEGLANGDALHPVQQAFLDHDGYQCGYCTPGQIASAVGLLAEAKAGQASFVTLDLAKQGPVDLTTSEIQERMSGNICRCGAYPGIVAAVRTGLSGLGANVQPFEYTRAEDTQAAVSALGRSTRAKVLAGGTNLIDLMKQNVEQPSELIDINRLQLSAIEELPDGGIRLGAMARNAETANHPLVRTRYPLLTQAILAGASPQLRNMASNGGNLLQRTRCYYFYDPAYDECNKRSPGSGCGAIKGFNRIHAVLGASDACIATHPSDMCVALSALGAKVRVKSGRGERMIAFNDFHRLPGKSPEVDTNLRPDELILSIDLPKSPFAEHSAYIKARDRASYAFALVSAAAGLELEGQTIRSARLSLGGVAHKPWRSEAAERLLVGKPPGETSFRAAADVAMSGAKVYEHNAFKVEMAKQVIMRALTVAGGQA